MGDTFPGIGTLVHDVGTAALAQAQAALAAGVRESKRNTGPVVDEYLARWHVQPPANWCAAALCSWMAEGCEALGCDMPIAGSPGARAVAAQFEAAGRWVSARKLTADHLVPGNVPIWWRVSRNDWRGHIGIIERVGGAVMRTIEGNSGKLGDRVSRMERSVADARLLGLGILSAGPPEYQPSKHQLREAGRLMKLGAEVMLGERADPLADFFVE